MERVLRLDGRGLLLRTSCFCARRPTTLADADRTSTRAYPLQHVLGGPGTGAGADSLDAHLLMHFDTHEVDPERHVFDVTFWIVPLAHWEFSSRQDVAPSEPRAGGALATYPVVPSAVVAHEPEEEMPFRSRWAFSEPGTRDVCGRDLARVLAEEAFPRVTCLLDRRTFLEETRVNRNGELVRPGGAAQSEIVLRIDDDPITEVTALVDKAEEDALPPSFVT